MRLGPLFFLLCLCLCHCNGAPPRDSRVPFNDEERKLIFEELLKPSCKSIRATETWEAIRAEHDKRRLVDKLPAFKQGRTLHSLRAHVIELRSKGLLPDEILKKFGLQQKGASSSNPPNQQTDSQIDEMIEELLNNTDYEIDFSKLKLEP